MPFPRVLPEMSLSPFLAHGRSYRQNSKETTATLLFSVHRVSFPTVGGFVAGDMSSPRCSQDPATSPRCPHVDPPRHTLLMSTRKLVGTWQPSKATLLVDDGVRI